MASVGAMTAIDIIDHPEDFRTPDPAEFADELLSRARALENEPVSPAELAVAVTEVQRRIAAVVDGLDAAERAEAEALIRLLGDACARLPAGR